MGHVISLIARKGGVGKTTIAANLARELAGPAGETQLVDADPQGSLSIWASMGSGFLSSRVTAVATGSAEEFRHVIGELRNRARLVVIDTPPGFTEPAILAAVASDLVLLPCGASPLDLAAGRDAIALCRKIQQQNPKAQPGIRLLPSRYLPNTGLGRELPGSLAKLGEAVLPGIAHRVALAEAAISGLTIGEYAPNSMAHREFIELAKGVWSYLYEGEKNAQAQVVGLR